MYLYTYSRICAWKRLAHGVIKEGEDQHRSPLLPNSTPLNPHISPGGHPVTYYPLRQFLNGYEISPFAIRIMEKGLAKK